MALVSYNLFSINNNVATKNFDTIINQINEGLFDRAKANVAGAVGTVKGMGARASGTLGAAKAAFFGDKPGVQAAADKAASGKQMGIDAKTQSIVGSHQQKLTKAIDDYANDLNKLKLSDPGSVNKLKQDLTSQIQSAVRAPTAPAASTGTPSAGAASGAAGSTPTSSGAPTSATASTATPTPTTATAPTAPTASTATPPAGSSAASPTTGTPTATSTAATPATTTPSPTDPTSLANPDSVKAIDAQLKDLANQEKILKTEMGKYQGAAKKAEFTAQLKGLEAQKQAAIKQKQAAQAALKRATSAAKISAYKDKQQAAGMNLNTKPDLTNASFVPTGKMFSELADLIYNIKFSNKYKTLS